MTKHRAVSPGLLVFLVAAFGLADVGPAAAQGKQAAQTQVSEPGAGGATWFAVAPVPADYFPRPPAYVPGGSGAALHLDTGDGPVITASDALGVFVHAAPGTVVKVSVTAARWQEDKATVLRGEITYGGKEPVPAEIAVPLVAGALNHIAVTATHPRFGHAGPQAFTVLARPGVGGPPVFFKQAAEKTVTQAELDAELRRIIEAAKKVSAELGQYLENNVSFYDGVNSATGTIGTSSSTMNNTRIRLSRAQWREALLAIKCAANEAERQRLREDMFRQLLSQVLHEATHRRGLVGGLLPGQPHRGSKEEKRATEELVNRMIDLLGQINTALTATDPNSITLGDGGGLRGEDLRLWFERLRTVIERQKLYRWQWLGDIPPWRNIARRLQSRRERFEAELKEIRDSNRPADQKRAAAQARLDHFLDHTYRGKTLREHAAEFADAHDMTWTLGFDPATLMPINRIACKTSFQGRPIPVLP